MTLETPSLASMDADRIAGLAAQFLSAGFLLLPGILGASEIEHFTGVLKRLDREVAVSSNGVSRRPGDPLEVRNLIGMAPDAVGLASNEVVLGLVCAIMGYNIQVHTSHAFIRPPFAPGTTVKEQQGLNWHYDMPGCAGAVNGTFPWLYTRVGFFLTDLLEPNSGGLKFVPGSHRLAARPSSPPESREPFGAIEARCIAGSVLLMDQRLWHATIPNYSTRERLSIYIGYSWRWIRPMDYRHYPSDLLDRHPPAVRQLLGDAVTQLGYVFPKEEDVPLREWCAVHGLVDVPAVATCAS